MSAKSVPISGGGGEWQIRSRGDTCLASGRAFADGEAFISRLVSTPEGVIREDYAEAAWTEALRDGSMSFWKSVYRLPPPPKAEALKKETAEETLRRLIEKPQPEHVATIFVLAVMLERKRLLVEKDVQHQPDGTRLRVYEHKLTGDAFVIVDPDLKMSEIAAVQDQVAEMMGWKPAEEPVLSNAQLQEQVGSAPAEEAPPAAAPEAPLVDEVFDPDPEDDVEAEADSEDEEELEEEDEFDDEEEDEFDDEEDEDEDEYDDEED